MARNYLDFHSDVEVFRKSVLHKDKRVWGLEAEEQPKSIRNLGIVSHGGLAACFRRCTGTTVSRRRGTRLSWVQPPYLAVGCTVAGAVAGSRPS